MCPRIAGRALLAITLALEFPAAGDSAPVEELRLKT